MSSVRLPALIAVATLLSSTASAYAAECGADLATFLQGVKTEAVASGIAPAAVDKALAGAQIDPKVLKMDRAQGVFRQTFLEFSKRTVSGARYQIGKKKMEQYASVFARAEQETGVPAAVITAFWGMETDFGAVQGDFNTRNALVTLSNDCRRPEVFRPQLIALIKLASLNDIDPQTTTGAWAGEIGQTQMLPADIIKYGEDGDGDGLVRLKDSAPDVILTTARFLAGLGFKRGEPWLQEVKIPQNLPFEKSGLGGTLTAGDWFNLGVTPRNGDKSAANLNASLVLPQGRFGPAFLAYPNFNVYLEWNQSLVYTLSAAYFATRLAGAEPYDPGNPEPGLSVEEMKVLQEKLEAKSHDVGKIDGILGSGTRTAVQKVQAELGLPADGWPDAKLLETMK
ncbi:lytic murein transglycosylase [Rhizobium sp. C1]|uniref:lytic murein transglycosylase n=1 Tax=Rhizobium sp. C1 TaxID=1349799 RepID=UPI001E5B5217|nr:lytic murein transglycosylase [Rhizobium sp. C1]MCD2176519.1 lytic murein transglycosylase [Rhizobium sp. C1]